MKFDRWIPLIHTKLERWWRYFVEMLPNFVLAIVVLAFFFFVARFIRNFVARFVLRISKSASVSGLVSGVIYSMIILFGLMTALDILKLDKTVSSLLAGVGIVGLALGFAFQDLTSNFISGAFIALKRPFEVGHTVETNGFLGTIEDIQLRSTTLRTSAGLHVIIPNKDIFQKPIINYSRTHQRRVELEFVIPNTIDASFAEKLVSNSIDHIASESMIREIEFYFVAIENPNMKMNVSFWTNNTEPREFMQARHKAIMAIYRAFAENEIYKVQIPQPASVS
jgi:small conductance mechanosensitive channel